MAALASKLRNELDRIEQPFIMALDDYYLIKEIFDGPVKE